MKNIFIYLVAESVAITSMLIAGLLAYNDKSGWGWFLAIAVVSQVGSYKQEKQEK